MNEVHLIDSKAKNSIYIWVKTPSFPTSEIDEHELCRTRELFYYKDG